QVFDFAAVKDLAGGISPPARPTPRLELLLVFHVYEPTDVELPLIGHVGGRLRVHGRPIVVEHVIRAYRNTSPPRRLPPDTHVMERVGPDPIGRSGLCRVSRHVIRI